jgi:hypothetical protein
MSARLFTLFAVVVACNAAAFGAGWLAEQLLHHLRATQQKRRERGATGWLKDGRRVDPCEGVLARQSRDPSASETRANGRAA